MQRVIDGLDSRRGIFGFVVVISLLAGFIVAADGLLYGDREVVGYFVVFVLALVGVAVIGALGWQRLRE
ncbi:hypothetical protein [Halovivax sp.]|uniref:hypothetical protein n=1 Tax=Halovivax sp. TaxID=1935978 RepID=UPI0025BC7C8D|nr:hypothetical protein [Halovivax sp.]